MPRRQPGRQLTAPKPPPPRAAAPFTEKAGGSQGSSGTGTTVPGSSTAAPSSHERTAQRGEPEALAPLPVQPSPSDALAFPKKLRGKHP